MGATRKSCSACWKQTQTRMPRITMAKHLLTMRTKGATAIWQDCYVLAIEQSAMSGVSRPIGVCIVIDLHLVVLRALTLPPTLWVAEERYPGHRCTVSIDEGVVRSC